jgi:ubiquinone/menaquinone biosynthesis C-methylase UbiE
VSFDLVAPYYQALETIAFGNALHRARIEWINKIPRPNRVLIVGEGNGRFLCDFLGFHEGVEIDCVDASKRMLEIARSRVRRAHPESSANVRFLQRDILHWEPQHSYDLIVTHFFLDCFEMQQLESIVGKLANVARKDAIWLLTDFTLPKGRLARAHSAVWLRAMYAFFGRSARIEAKNLVDPRAHLEAEGFRPVAVRLSRWKMLSAGIYARSASSPHWQFPR